MSDKERYKLDMEQLYSHWKLKEPAIRFVPTKSGEGEKIINFNCQTSDYKHHISKLTCYYKKC